MHRWILIGALAFAGVMFVAPSRGAAQDKKEEAPALTAVQKSNVAVLDALLRAVRQNFYDKRYRGLDLAKLREKYLQPVLDSRQGAPLHKVLNQLIAEFKVSHFGVMEGDVYSTNFVPEMNNTFSVRPGIDIACIHGEFFVGGIYQDSAAEHAGLLRGDRLVLVNGQPIEQCPLLVDAGSDPGIPGEPHYFLRVPDDAVEISLGVQRKRGDERLTSITLKPTAINMISATRKSVSVIEYKGRKFGYIRFWHFLHDGMTQALRNAIRKDWKDCDGAIIDLRGRGGSPLVMNACMAPFGTPPPLGRMFGGNAYNMPKWSKPVVALQDCGSRSAKEIYAHNWKYLNIGPVVGETTPGAVLGSSFVELPDGSYMIMPMQEASGYCYGNVKLEGNGVAPTHAVKDLLAYAEGVDTIKEAGIKVIFDLVKEAPAPAKEAIPEKKPKVAEDEEEEFFAAESAPWLEAPASR